MTIRKIISLKGIGRFEDFKASGDVEFKKYTLIFADNGTGKTTLCDVIRSLQTGIPDYILGRRTLGTTIDPEACILLSDGTRAVFQNGAWSRTLGDVTIFDANYVSQNVHAGEVVAPDHRRNLFQVVVGEEGVRLARKVEKLESEKSQLNSPIRLAKQAVEGGLNGEMKLAAYMKLTADPAIDEKRKAAERGVAAAQKADEIRRHRGFEVIVTPEVPYELANTLGETLDGVSEEAERRLRDHVTKLSGGGAGRWLSDGMAYVDGETCPFCEQSIKGNDLVAAYRACFSTAYSELSERLAALKRAIEQGFGPVATSRMKAQVAQNVQTVAFWADYFELDDLFKLDLEAIEEVMARAHDTLIELLERKSGNLLEPITEIDPLKPLCGELETITLAISAYNTKVEAGNGRVQAQKAAVDVVDVAIARAKLGELTLLKRRFEEPALTNCASYQALMNQKADLEKQKDAAREALDAYTTKVVAEYEGTLNKHLDRFLVGFRIQGTKTEMPRGYPSSSYSIVINGVPVDLGTESTTIAEPSFKNTLSGGDRSALALSLFMAELERSSTPPEIAVILDDPFQSQDAFRQNATAFQIKRCGDRSGQVIVMSHDPHFLKLIWDELPTDGRKTLRLSSVGRGNTLSEWDINEHLKEAHQANLDALQRYLDDGMGAARDVAQKLRPTLEGYCRTICYGEFPDGMMMGDIIAKVRGTGPSHALHGILDELEELNVFARRYHHVSNPSASTEDLNEGELRGYASRILRLTRPRLAA